MRRGAAVTGRLADEEGRVRATPAVAVVGSSGMLAMDSCRPEVDGAVAPGRR